MIIAISQNNKLIYGQVAKIAKLLDLHPATIHRWIKSGVQITIENGYTVYLNTEKI